MNANDSIPASFFTAAAEAARDLEGYPELKAHGFFPCVSWSFGRPCGLFANSLEAFEAWEHGGCALSKRYGGIYAVRLPEKP